MLKNYFTVALRNLIRYRAYSFLNIAGLGIGLTASILILLWVRDELAYDRFHKAARQIYRLTVDISGVKGALTSPPVAQALKKELPEVANSARVAITNQLFIVGDRKFEEKSVFFADPSFLEVFDFPLLKGDAGGALTQPDGLLLTEAMARKYFGNEDPIGKTIRMSPDNSFTVRGVLRNVPSHSHLQFGFVLPMSFLAARRDDIKNNLWDYYTNIYTYVQLRPQVPNDAATLAGITRRIDQLYLRNEQKVKTSFTMQPLTDIHLKSENLVADVPGHGNLKYVRIFSLVAAFILVVAAINFMNLATARAGRRAREVGMRKALGANAGQLIGQFLGESLLISALALLVALVLVMCVLPAFNELTGKQLYLALLDADLLFGLLAIVLLVGLLAGSYPALYLSSFKPIQSLKGAFRAGPKSTLFRNALVVVQFVVTIVLFVGTVIVYRQVNFMQRQSLGFDRENLLYVLMKGDMYDNYPAMRSELEGSNVIRNFAITTDLPTNMKSSAIDVQWEGKNANEQPIFPVTYVDNNFVQTMNMQMVAGRSFAKEFTADTSNYVVNQTALKIMRLDPATAVGKPLTVFGKRGVIIGVVKDFHFRSLQQTIEPLIMGLNTFGGYVMVKTNPDNTEATIGELKRIFGKLNPTYPFEYKFLDEDYDALYRTEKRMSTFSGVFAVLAIFISCLGLFGLSAFMAEQRVREIGVRKVLGATVSSLVLLLSKGYVRLVVVALLLATPLAWYLMNRWLSDYAYHVPVSGWVILLAGIVALVIALAATIFQTIKASMTNPVKALRTE
jgi:ABC-type antimicrobial peptide transport system permease subunit